MGPTSPSTLCTDPSPGRIQESCGPPARPDPPSRCPGTWKERPVSAGRLQPLRARPAGPRLPSELLAGAQRWEELLRRTLQHQEDGPRVGWGADLLRPDLRGEAKCQAALWRCNLITARETECTSIPLCMMVSPFFRALMSGPIAAVPLQRHFRKKSGKSRLIWVRR